MKLDYDPIKRRKVLVERGLDFEAAREVFAGLHATLRDDRMNYGEERFQTYGFLGGRVVMVVWTLRADSRRIISMRHCHADEEKKSPERSWRDPDDALAWSEAMFDRAEIGQGEEVLRASTGTVTKRGRPRLAAPKRQVSVRLDPAVIDELRRANPKWQVALTEVLGTWAEDRRAKRSGHIKSVAGTDVTTEKSRNAKTPARRRSAARKTGT